ncbi:MAG: RHS repeat-associated core domain-containing protein, partial [Eubacterium sp.]|nr:RHS repeat-associated core domain-containing protein [Eubacterium sp.]
MSDDEIAKTLFEVNPLLYRGYYYDKESGMYYLQSRYYNPKIQRFISADDFSNIDTSKKYFNMNAYIYC